MRLAASAFRLANAKNTVNNKVQNFIFSPVIFSIE
jgi:hypothetical protein